MIEDYFEITDSPFEHNLLKEETDYFVFENDDYFSEKRVSNGFYSVLGIAIGGSGGAFIASFDFLTEFMRRLINQFANAEGKKKTLDRYFKQFELDYHAAKFPKEFQWELDHLIDATEKLSQQKKFKECPLITNEVISMFCLKSKEDVSRMVKCASDYFGFVASKSKDIKQLGELLKFKVNKEDCTEKNIKTFGRFCNLAFNNFFRFIDRCYIDFKNYKVNEARPGNMIR